MRILEGNSITTATQNFTGRWENIAGDTAIRFMHNTSVDGSPRLRRPFTAKDTTFFEESPYGGIQLQAGDDIVVRITAATASNLDITAGYDLVCIKD